MKTNFVVMLLTLVVACDEQDADTDTGELGTDIDTSDTDTDPSDDTDPTTQSRSSVNCTYGAAASSLTSVELAAPGAFEVDSETDTWYDTSRPAVSDDWWAPDGRPLAVQIWYPATSEWWELDSHVVGSDLPLVVYSHGFSSSKDEASFLGAHLASHGYIVIAPTFPLTNLQTPGGPDMADIVNQPGDVSFLIDQMLAKSSLASDKFFGTVDGDRVAVAGTSLGGMTSSLVTYHRSLHDPRIKAAVTLAGPGSMFDTSFYDHRAVPLLALHGDIDAIVDYDHNALRTVERAAPYATLVTIENGSHTAFAPIPFEDLVLDVLGALVAPDGAHPDNPDRLGCGIIADNMPENASFLDAMGGAANGMTTADDPTPCAMTYLSQAAIEPSVQREIAAVAVLAFFEAYMAEELPRREAACIFLDEGLPDIPGVSVSGP